MQLWLIDSDDVDVDPHAEEHSGGSPCGKRLISVQ